MSNVVTKYECLPVIMPLILQPFTACMINKARNQRNAIFSVFQRIAYYAIASGNQWGLSNYNLLHCKQIYSFYS